MRHLLTGMCILAMLCLAQASAATSSSAHKRKAAAHSSAPNKQHAREQHGRERNTSVKASKPHSAAHSIPEYAAFESNDYGVRDPAPVHDQVRVPTHPVPQSTRSLPHKEVAHRAPAATHHKRRSVGEARLDRIREFNERSRTEQSIDTEYAERSSLIETPTRHTRQLAALTMPLREMHISPLRGSHESLVRQNERSDDEGLERIEDEEDLRDRIASKALVRVPLSAALAINSDLPENHRYCRPWTATFLKDLARAHAAAFKTPLVVTSAVRTVEYQKHLRGVNGNAAAAEGDIASPHLTGGSIDIGKHGMSRNELTWMRTWLLLLQHADKIDVEEEFKQACFHITVYKSYVPASPRHTRPRPQPANADVDTAQIATAGE